MSAAKNTAEIVALGEARAQREAGAPTLDTAGAMLRAAREDAGLGIAEVSDEINVKAERLEAIEAMNLEMLPAAPYALGFVRAYAGFLGLPVEPLVARFREEAGWAKPVTAPKIAAPKAPPRDREVGLVGVLVVLGFVVWAVWQIVGRTPPEEEAALPSGFPIADRTEEVRVVPEVTTSLEDDLTLTPPVVVGDAGEPAAAEEVGVARPALDSRPVAQDAGASRFALLPVVLTRPLGAPPEPEPEPAQQPRATPAESLNERFLEQVLADSGVGAAPSGPVTAEAAPAPPRQREAAPTRPAARPADEPPARAERFAARLTDPVSPVYPRRCQRRAAEEEVVTVAFNVSRFGRVTGPSVAATTNSCFDDAALAAVSRFGFAPATEGGRAVREAGRTSRIVFRKP